MLEWLAISLSDQQLQDARIVSAVECVIRVLASQRYLGSAPRFPRGKSPRLGMRCNVLAIYDERVFKPMDAVEKPANQEQTPATAGQARASKAR